MREILFRGKRKDNGKWICGGYLHSDPNGIRHSICSEDMIAQVYPETVGQYTGLVDQNGLRIFEGDLVRTRAFVLYKAAVISYSNGSFRVCPIDQATNPPLSKYVFEKKGIAEGVEIIGNVSDNPEIVAQERKEQAIRMEGMLRRKLLSQSRSCAPL